jgi:hypothetical protein
MCVDLGLSIYLFGPKPGLQLLKKQQVWVRALRGPENPFS